MKTMIPNQINPLQPADKATRTTQNLNSNVDRLVREFEIKSSFWKTLTIGVIGFFAALGFGYFSLELIHTTSKVFVLFLSFLSLFTVFFTLQSFLINNQKFGYSFVFLQSVALFIPLFINGFFSLAVVSGFLLTFMFLAIGYGLGQKEMGLSLSVRFFRVGSVILGQVIVAITLFLVFSYLAVAALGSASPVSKEVIVSVFKPGTAFIQSFYPDFSLEESVSHNINIIATRGVDEATADQPITPSERQMLISQTAAEYQRALVEAIGSPIDTMSGTVEVLQNFLSNQVDQFLNRFGLGTYFIAGLIAVLIVKSIAPLLIWPVLILTFLFFQLFLAFGFFAILRQSRSQEFIALK